MEKVNKRKVSVGRKVENDRRWKREREGLKWK